MNRHYCRALIAFAFILAGTLPLAAFVDRCYRRGRTVDAVLPEGRCRNDHPLPDLTATTADEPLLYLSTPNPVISSDILTVPPGGVTRWMTHPVPACLYILQGDLTVQLADCRKEQTFHAGQVLLQPRAAWHRGRMRNNVHFAF